MIIDLIYLSVNIIGTHVLIGFEIITWGEESVEQDGRVLLRIYIYIERERER